MTKPSNGNSNAPRDDRPTPRPPANVRPYPTSGDHLRRLFPSTAVIPPYNPATDRPATRAEIDNDVHAMITGSVGGTWKTIDPS